MTAGRKNNQTTAYNEHFTRTKTLKNNWKISTSTAQNSYRFVFRACERKQPTIKNNSSMLFLSIKIMNTGVQSIIHDIFLNKALINMLKLLLQQFYVNCAWIILTSLDSGVSIINLIWVQFILHFEIATSKRYYKKALQEWIEDTIRPQCLLPCQAKVSRRQYYKRPSSRHS